MSGGSFNYLCYAVSNLGAEEIFNRDADLESMAKALEVIGGSNAALRDTKAVIEKIAAIRRELGELCERLSPVWKAVEWYYSSDWGADKVTEAVNQYAIEHGSVIKLVDSDE